MVDIRGGIYIYLMYVWHSEGMSTRNEELLGKVLEVADRHEKQLIIPGESVAEEGCMQNTRHKLGIASKSRGNMLSSERMEAAF